MTDKKIIQNHEARITELETFVLRLDDMIADLKEASKPEKKDKE